MAKDRTRRLFIAAGVSNILGILGFTRLFTNELLAQTDPRLFSDPGAAIVVVWGLGYIALSGHYRRLPKMAAVFALEKALYTACWLHWHLSEPPGTLAELFAQDWMTGLFYASYGVVDGFWGLFFLSVWWRWRGAEG